MILQLTQQNAKCNVNICAVMLNNKRFLNPHKPIIEETGDWRYVIY